MESPPARKVKVAVVGSGLAGLTAAHLVSTSSNKSVEFEVHIFEKSPILGMDSHSVSLDVNKLSPSGATTNSKEWLVDVPMRSFQGGYYPRLIALYNHLGVAFHQSDFSYSFSTLFSNARKPPSIVTEMIYNGASGRAGVSMPSSSRPTSPQSKTYDWLQITSAYISFLLSTLMLVFNYARVSILSAPPLRPKDPYLTFRQWSSQTTPTNYFARVLGLDRAWKHFCDFVLVALFSAVCTASREEVLEHPVGEFLDYIWLTLFTHHYVVSRGVRDVVARLSESVSPSNIHTSCPVAFMSPDPQDLSKLTLFTLKTSYSGFSHVIFATQANTVVPLLKSYAAALRASNKLGRSRDFQRTVVDEAIDCLSAFNYCRTVVVNHTDDSLMPSDRSDWRDLNLVVSSSNIDQLKDEMQICLPASYAMATHAIPRPSSLHLQPDLRVYQTTNPIVPPDTSRILSIARLERAVLSVKSKAALRKLQVEDRGKWQSHTSAKVGLGVLQGGGKLVYRSAEGPGEGDAIVDHGVPGLWFCGSYAHGGIPLLEGCVVSARNVADCGVLKCEDIQPCERGW